MRLVDSSLVSSSSLLLLDSSSFCNDDRRMERNAAARLTLPGTTVALDGVCCRFKRPGTDDAKEEETGRRLGVMLVDARINSSSSCELETTIPGINENLVFLADFIFSCLFLIEALLNCLLAPVA